MMCFYHAISAVFCHKDADLRILPELSDVLCCKTCLVCLIVVSAFIINVFFCVYVIWFYLSALNRSVLHVSLSDFAVLLLVR